MDRQRVLLYDTTLRDGMQGEGMSLSVDEKVRVAHALDGLGVHFIEAGFPSSNPKEEALFALLAEETFEHAEVEAGAENVTLCDTNGSSLPAQVADATRHVVTDLGPEVSVGIHTHDDAGCGVANSLAAVEHGARLVQGTMNGYGERCGNANLTSILPALQLKLGYECVSPQQIVRLTETSHLVDEICNVSPNPNQPYVGKNAFAHKGGMHVAGIVRDARTFEH